MVIFHSFLYVYQRVVSVKQIQISFIKFPKQLCETWSTAVVVMSRRQGLPKSPMTRFACGWRLRKGGPLTATTTWCGLRGPTHRRKGPNDSLSTNDPIEILRNINTSHVFLFFMSTVNFHKTIWNLFFLGGETPQLINQGLLIRGHWTSQNGIHQNPLPKKRGPRATLPERFGGSTQLESSGPRLRTLRVLRCFVWPFWIEHGDSHRDYDDVHREHVIFYREIHDFHRENVFF